MKCDFSLKHYRSMLKEAQKAGFVFTNFKDFSKIKAEKVILLRHDVDSIPEKHLKIAEIEKKLGIKSTYFIRVHGEYYGIFEKKNYKTIQKIIKLGHEIGLHTEARVYAKAYQENAKEILFKEKKILEQLFEVKIESASEHAEIGRPKNFWQNHLFKQIKYQTLGIKNQPFQIRFSKFKYLSDSLSKWREGCLCQNLEKYQKIQLLVHAEVWGENARQDLIKIDPRLSQYV